MDLSYSAVEGRSRSYKALVVILAILALAGLASFVISYLKGHQVLGGSNVVPWGMPIVFLISFFFLKVDSILSHPSLISVITFLVFRLKSFGL